MSRKDIFYGGSVMQLAEEQVSEEMLTYNKGGLKSRPKV